jgi:hypothetical protein
MKMRGITAAALGGILLVGCASVLGIKDLPSDAGAGDAGGSSGSSGSGSGSGGSSGSGSGSGGGSGSGSGGASRACTPVLGLGCTGGTTGYTCLGGATPDESQPSLVCSSAVVAAGGATDFCCTTPIGGGIDAGTGGTCSPPAGAACRIDPGCGCPDGEKCSYASTCVAAGTLESGSLCNAETDCAAGLTCAAAVCKPYCNAPGVQCPAPTGGPPLGLCVQIYDTNDQPISQDQYCLLACTPSPNSCGTGQTCDIVTVNSVAHGNCVAAGTGIAGAACTASTDCVAGTACFNSSSGQFCAQPCRTNGDCANLTGTTCNTAMGGLVDGVEYGVCFR